MTVRARIASALAANAFGQAVTIGSQLLLTPLYFRVWGAALYGEWLILSSLPAYLAMADLGIGSAAGNEMAMRASAGDRRGAQQTFFGALLVSLLASGLAMVVGVAAAAVAFVLQMPPTPHIAALDAAWILLALACNVSLGFTGSVVAAGFRCADRYALGVSLANASRLLELLVTGVLLWLGQSPLFVCLAALGSKILMLAAQALWLRAICAWLFASGVTLDRGLVRRLIAPALGFLALPMGNALALQGPVLVIGMAMGGSAVATFTALRTLARVPMQITNMINASVWPEMSRAFGAGDAALLRKLHRTAWGTTLWLNVATGAGVVAVGGHLTYWWLGDDAHYDAAVLAALVLLTVLAAIWGASGVVLAAINAHMRFGAVYVVVMALAMGLAAVLSTHLGWAGLFVPLLLADASMLVWVLSQAMRTTKDEAGSFIAAALALPWNGARRLLSGR